MNLKSVFLGFAFAGFSTSAALACPWAAGTYKGSVPPDITLKVTFNADCTSASLVDSGGKAKKLPIARSGKAWTLKYDTTVLSFDNKGKRVNVRRGGAQRTIKMRKL